MSIILTIAIILLWLGLVIFSRPLTTFIHEMGHAIPALLFTNETVIVHVGSYGDLSKSIEIKMGRLSIFFKLHWMSLQLGLCRHASAKEHWQVLLTILGGPLMSLLFAIGLIVFMAVARPSDGWMTILTLFVLSSIWDFFINIVPRDEPIPLHDGGVAFNDGYQLMAVLQDMKQPESFHQAMELFYNKKYEEAMEAFQDIVEGGFENKVIHLRIIDCLVAEKEYKTAIRHYQWVANKYPLTPFDYLALGKIYRLDNQFQEALQQFNQYLYFIFRDANALVERGKLWLEMREFRQALQDFDSATHRSPELAEAWLYRGWARMKLEDWEGGKTDIEYATQLDKNNPFNYFYLGNYYEEKGNNAKALELYEKAKSMNIDFHGIEYFIYRVS